MSGESACAGPGLREQCERTSLKKTGAAEGGGGKIKETFGLFLTA